MQVKSKRCILRQKQAIMTSIGKLNSTQLHRRRGGARKYKGAIEINFQENKDKRVDLPFSIQDTTGRTCTTLHDWLL